MDTPVQTLASVRQRGGAPARPRRDMRFREEAFVVWSAARAEANLAYDWWCRAPGAAAYAVYRAAEDRADEAERTLTSL